ncbi:hypothetical protein [Burkholderia pseudomallei]|uniref:hypothetical protein n=1 Tax=Burkholderia pseudomallei TaxID=28450 RepID=UPI0012931D63|nr:hypothetical protein [Burkholderia pseudomallei]MBM5620544.1 hypothetical protein [Burkholderia pseudomallei]
MRRISIAAASDASARLRPLRPLQPSSSLLVSFSFFAWAWAWACIMIAMNRADARANALLTRATGSRKKNSRPEGRLAGCSDC